MTQIPLQRLIQKGKIVFVINNLEASERFLKAKDASTARACRYVDLNMNRLPDKNLGGSSSEEMRARELGPVWQTFDYALDIHSTIQETRAMVVLGQGPETEVLARKLGIGTLVGNILKVQSGFPAISYYGHSQSSVLGVEVGSHEDPQSMRRAIHTAAKFLHATGVMPDLSKELGIQDKNQKTQLFNVYGKIKLTHPEGKLVKVFEDFSPFSKGELLAYEPGQEYRADRDGFALFGPPQTTPIYLGEETLFLTESIDA